MGNHRLPFDPLVPRDSRSFEELLCLQQFGVRLLLCPTRRNGKSEANKKRAEPQCLEPHLFGSPVGFEVATGVRPASGKYEPETFSG
jgi:hypothetical protein